MKKKANASAKDGWRLEEFTCPVNDNDLTNIIQNHTKNAEGNTKFSNYKKHLQSIHL